MKIDPLYADIGRTLSMPAFWAGAEESRKQCGVPGGHAVAIRTALKDGKKLGEIAEYHQWLGKPVPQTGIIR